VIHVDGTVCRTALSRRSQSRGASAGSAAIVSAAVDWMVSARFHARMARAARTRGGGCAAAVRAAGRLDRGAGGCVTSCPRCLVRPKAAKGGLLAWASPCRSGRPDGAVSSLTLRFRRLAAGRQEAPWKILAGAGLAGDPGGSREAPVMPAGCWLPGGVSCRLASAGCRGPRNPPG
jgi:hypothetical protein